MRLCVKRVYCRACRRLVKCRERKVNNGIEEQCSRCGKTLGAWNGITWRHA
ncbi:MAG: hypothetical protein HY530_01415 [Chloroflexi bacterium]|nr:hypothetical protein [Chloroflexota bacterium]